MAWQANVESTLAEIESARQSAAVFAALRAGADTAARRASGKTALQLAKEEGHAECVKAFRQHGKESVVAGRPTVAAGGGGQGRRRRRLG